MLFRARPHLTRKNNGSSINSNVSPLPSGRGKYTARYVRRPPEQGPQYASKQEGNPFPSLPQPWVIKYPLPENLVIEPEYSVANGHFDPPFSLSICRMIDPALHRGSGDVFPHGGNSTSEPSSPSPKHDKWPVQTSLLCFKYVIGTIYERLR